MKRANRDLNNHDRGVVWEITRLLIKGDLASGNKMIKIIDKIIMFIQVSFSNYTVPGRENIGSVVVIYII